MTLRVIGAGLPRTGTHSLKLALEQLLGGPCYHMREVFDHAEHVPLWHAAVRGEAHAWDEIFDGYVAAVDWPVSAFWRELTSAYPDAVVLLSVRESPERWWRSADQTVWNAIRSDGGGIEDWHAMVVALTASRFTPDWRDPDACIAAYERHNADVRTELGPRAIEFRPEDGWGPICDALGLPVPDEAYPLTNTSAEWHQRRAERSGSEP